MGTMKKVAQQKPPGQEVCGIVVGREVPGGKEAYVHMIGSFCYRLKYEK
jgi:hypothetical protein